MFSPGHSLSTLCDATLALVYPQACAVCRASVESRHDGVVCETCWDIARLMRAEETICWKCGLLTRATVNAESRSTVHCHRCDQDAYDAARACGFYEGALRAAI